MENPKVQTITLFYYLRNDKECVTPSLDIAIARRDEGSEIKVEQVKGDNTELSILNI